MLSGSCAIIHNLQIVEDSIQALHKPGFGVLQNYGMHIILLYVCTLDIHGGLAKSVTTVL